MCNLFYSSLFPISRYSLLSIYSIRYFNLGTLLKIRNHEPPVTVSDHLYNPNSLPQLSCDSGSVDLILSASGNLLSTRFSLLRSLDFYRGRLISRLTSSHV